MTRPRIVRGGAPPDDPRVVAVLEVLAGQPVVTVAARHGVESALVHRWVRGFVEAGTAHVTNAPDENTAAQRDRFLAAFAHELRTPLTVARGWAGLLEDDDLPPQILADTAEKLTSALDRLTERVEDVQFLAAASLGRLSVEPRPTSIVELTADLDPAPEIEGDVELHVDVALFRRVLRDLWTAAETVPVPKRRVLQVEAGRAWTEIRVVRIGPGIEPFHLQALFDPFDTNDDATGITIGLYLARALVVAHGGTLGVEQDETHTVFWVRLPARNLTDRNPTNAD